jgi:hypothetical protein
VAVIFLLLLLCIIPASGASREPFSIGYGMATNGAILQPDGIPGREPFTSACFYNDSLRFGVTVAGVDYYDPMDNMSSSHIGQAALGGFFAPRRGALKGFVLKGAYLQFDAMRVYYEQQGMLSIGCSRVPFVKPSLELAGFRAGLYHANDPSPQTRLEMGASAMVPFRVAAISLNVNHIPLKKANILGYDDPLVVRIGLHSGKNSLGGQGILMELEQDEVWRFRIVIGEEYWLMKNLAASLALTTNPVIINFGVTCAFDGSSSITAAFVDHPVLGWSKGLAASWAGK